MKRKICSGCDRPEKVCLCENLKFIENFHSVTVLRHKSETGHPLNTVKLLEKALATIEVYDGEHFPENSVQLPEYSYLVYPDDNAQDISTLEFTGKANFIFLDGSWKKTRKLLYTNPWLNELPKVQIPFQESRYFLRKQKEDGFSTLEAAYSVLSILENNPKKYQSLLDILDRLMEIQSGFIQPEILQDHFGNRLSKISSGKHGNKVENPCSHNSLDDRPQRPKIR